MRGAASDASYSRNLLSSAKTNILPPVKVQHLVIQLASQGVK